MVNKQNLQPVRTKEEARERGRNGGIKSGQARREKKLLSEFYGEVLADLYKVDARKGDSAKNIIKKILARGDSASVSMLKEMREATEGSKVEHTGNIPVQIIIEGVKTEDTGP